ncbi:hypothetical protein D9613_009225 [Agrocybe pediades]|uniref:Uncharacterized protein n=1 Tax=Agrocybe pediades TaxID=84607 RepID=A0A8H4VU45_9AGAR|nr:hypothetical protein D9613_009225 [Agrocybe pediades]
MVVGVIDEHGGLEEIRTNPSFRDADNYWLCHKFDKPEKECFVHFWTYFQVVAGLDVGPTEHDSSQANRINPTHQIVVSEMAADNKNRSDLLVDKSFRTELREMMYRMMISEVIV